MMLYLLTSFFVEEVKKEGNTTNKIKDFLLINEFPR